MNGVSKAPDGTLVSSPIPQVVVIATSRRSQRPCVATIVDPQANGFSGPPGTAISFRGSGFQCGVDCRECRHIPFIKGRHGAYELAGVWMSMAATWSSRPSRPLSRPSRPADAATLTLRNESTGATVGPFNVMVLAPAPLRKPAPDVIHQWLTDTIDSIVRLPTASPDEATSLQRAASSSSTQARTNFDDLAKAGLTPELTRLPLSQRRPDDCEFEHLPPTSCHDGDGHGTGWIQSRCIQVNDVLSLYGRSCWRVVGGIAAFHRHGNAPGRGCRRTGNWRRHPDGHSLLWRGSRGRAAFSTIRRPVAQSVSPRFPIRLRHRSDRGWWCTLRQEAQGAATSRDLKRERSGVVCRQTSPDSF